MKRTFFAIAAIGLLAGCQSDAGSMQSTPVRANPIPDIGFDAQVSNAAVDACRNALVAQTNTSVDVVASEFSQANSTVYMQVGTQRAPWRCLVSNSGAGAELMFLGTDGDDPL